MKNSEPKLGRIAPVRRWWKGYVHLLLPVLFFMVMFLFFPFRERFEFDLDEGGEAMKSLLVARGYPLYFQVWSDQPPVLTYILAVGLRGLGPDVDAGRTVILLFSTVLLAAAVHFLRTNWGIWHAITGAVFIFLLPFYNSLSVSLMFGLPAISFAMLSLLALSLWHQRLQNIWLILSAIALAFSVQTKLFTAFLAPIFVLGILLQEWAKRGRSMNNWWELFRPAIVWGLVFSTLVVAIFFFVVGPANIDELINTHLEARQLSTYISQVNAEPIAVRLRDAWPILLLACVGPVFVILERQWTSLYLFAWAVCAYLLLAFHAPVWFHHQLLVSIPAAMLAAIAAIEGIRMLSGIFRRRAFLTWRSLLATSALVSFAVALVVRLPLTMPRFYRPPFFVTGAAHVPWAEQMFLTKMANHAPNTHWVVTDLPMYAFRVGLLVPPNLSFITEKSLATGEVTEEQIIHTIEIYRPEQVLMGRREYPLLKQYLQSDYRLLYERGKRDLYLRKDLKGQ